MKNPPCSTSVLLALLLPALAASAVTIQYTYDEAGRLTRADYGGGEKIDYVYDANGNLLQRTVSGSGEITYTLIYRAGTGGTIGGVATQEVAVGGNGSPVTAVVDNASVVFRRWSDGATDPIRTDTNVQANLTIQAAFRSTGGADLDWYAARGIAPGGGEDWTDVDARAVAGKGTTLRHENIADTDPANTANVFRVTGIEARNATVVHFEPGSTGRVYTFQFNEALNDGAWSNVPGVDPRPGAGGEDAMADTNNAAARRYRVTVEVPN
ncbi:MAG: RHS repeat protein [Kiritimatiellae bacterium]|nr:RHS repeat protein [Kiritimatiellia bacterium]